MFLPWFWSWIYSPDFLASVHFPLSISHFHSPWAKVRAVRARAAAALHGSRVPLRCQPGLTERRCRAPAPLFYPTHFSWGWLVKGWEIKKKRVVFRTRARVVCFLRPRVPGSRPAAGKKIKLGSRVSGRSSRIFSGSHNRSALGGRKIPAEKNLKNREKSSLTRHDLARSLPNNHFDGLTPRRTTPAALAVSLARMPLERVSSREATEGTRIPIDASQGHVGRFSLFSDPS